MESNRFKLFVILFISFISKDIQLFGQNRVVLDSTIRHLEYFIGTWTALAQGAGGKPILYSIHSIEPILDGKFIRRSVVQGFNGLELKPYTDETIGWNIVRKKLELVNHNAPGFIIYGSMNQLDSTTFERNWILYNWNGVELKGRDTWSIKSSNLFEWRLHFFRNEEWVEAPYSPFNMNRSS